MSTPAQFASFAAEGYNRIPVVREVLSDLDTPLSVYLKLADGPNTYLFESVEGGETWGRYSIIGLPAKRSFHFRGNAFEERELDVIVAAETLADPLAKVDDLRARYRVPKLPQLPDFSGGLVGYFGFETIAWIEPKLKDAGKPDVLGVPDALLLLSEEVAVFDNLKGRLYLIVHADPAEPQAYARAQRRLDELVYRLRHSGRSYPDVLHPSLVDEADFVSGFSEPEFTAAVRKAQEYIKAGDAFQVVLSQRMSVPFKARPVDVYRALRALNPSPYMYFLDFGGTQVVGSSPEILVRAKQGRVTVR
ncbi:MAG: chorismate-binding protein, partial [Arenimonas sp.]|nr:chorismate-binding protein [Arenimonas sp.]